MHKDFESSLSILRLDEMPAVNSGVEWAFNESSLSTFPLTLFSCTEAKEMGCLLLDFLFLMAQH